MRALFVVALAPLGLLAICIVIYLVKVGDAAPEPARGLAEADTFSFLVGTLAGRLTSGQSQRSRGAGTRA